MGQGIDFGKEINGAKAWYSFGAFSFQPVEFTNLQRR
ncbi:MAG: FtsW/RodA/SpoVE family cell cycle protein [Saprospiraceae bacterium]|nr:FtsW/RodA/SpoVE family cell cycle protein [Saprospiraceae bacterium]